MTKRMLIDATHAEETRVVVLDGSRLEDFDVETAAKAQLKGNIYLAKVVRVEPSLQAAFVEYGGGRHGFLAFGEIHPDYYQIPVADRQRLLEMQEAEARAEEEAEDAAAAAAEAAEAAGEPEGADVPPPLPLEDMPEPQSQAAAIERDMIFAHEQAEEAEPAPGIADALAAEPGDEPPAPLETAPLETAPQEVEAVAPDAPESIVPEGPAVSAQVPDEPSTPAAGTEEAPAQAEAHAGEDVHAQPDLAPGEGEDFPGEAGGETEGDTGGDTGGENEGDNGADRHESRPPARFMRSYKIQEVIRRRQILLVQVVKEERGTKGAALTTFISLAGRFCVLMPNSPRGGGISRKITSAADRRRLKEVIAELRIPRGMGLIVRTAGAARPKAEIKRDCEYLLELWDNVRETTMASVAPALIHEEANLIRRAIRDNYSRDVDEVLVDGEGGWRAARDFMRMLMPAHARKVILWTEPQPLFAKHGVEAQLDGMLQPTAQLRSGGYLVINQTEALVAIDVNSGRSTRERGIEETALKTNLEAADEVARQLRLRDLAGLIVVDFIDMESRRNNAAVERRMKEALKDDRARIQIGSISHFGLMELSRQRLRPSLAETSFITCPHCGGTGHVRATESAALAVLRAVEEEGAKRRAAAVTVHVAGAIALYILNHKRARLAEIEARYGMAVSFAADESLVAPANRIERTRAQTTDAPLPAIAAPAPVATPEEDDLAVEEADEEATEEREEAEAPAAEAGEEPERSGRHRRRRRRGSGHQEDAPAAAAPDEAAAPVDPAAAEQPEVTEPGEAAQQAAAEEEAKASRRRGRRGGRRRRRDPADPATEGEAEAGPEQPASFDAPSPSPAYTGPTPADPFGGTGFDLWDMMDQPDEPRPIPAAPAPSGPEAEAAAPPSDPAPPPPEPVAAEATTPPPSEPDAAARPAREAEAAEATVPAAPEPAAPEPAAPEPAPAEAAPELAPPEVAPSEAASPEHAQVDGTSHVNGHATAEPVSAPVPPPVLVGNAPPPEKKRGWWGRR